MNFDFRLLPGKINNPGINKKREKYLPY